MDEEQLVGLLKRGYNRLRTRAKQTELKAELADEEGQGRYAAALRGLARGQTQGADQFKSILIQLERHDDDE